MDTQIPADVVQRYLLSAVISDEITAVAIVRCLKADADPVLGEVVRQLRAEVTRRGGDSDAPITTTLVPAERAAETSRYIEQSKRRNFRRFLPSAVIVFVPPGSPLLRLHQS